MGGRRSPRKKKKEKKKEKRKEKERKKGTMNNVKLLHIKCCFFQFFNWKSWNDAPDHVLLFFMFNSLCFWAVYCDRPTQLSLEGERGGQGGGRPKKVALFQRHRHEEFSSGDSTWDFGLRSFRRPEIYCEGPPSFIWRERWWERRGKKILIIALLLYCSTNY